MPGGGGVRQPGGRRGRADANRLLHLNGGGAMRLENQAALAQIVVAGDRSYAGPLVGVPLGLPVLHVFEPEVRDQVPGDVYEAQVALMETSAGARPYKNGRMGYEAAFGSRLINDPSRRSAVRLSKMTSSRKTPLAQPLLVTMEISLIQRHARIAQISSAMSTSHHLVASVTSSPLIE